MCCLAGKVEAGYPLAVHYLPSPSAGWSFLTGLWHPGPFLQPRSKYIEDLGAFVSCLFNTVPFGRQKAMCSRAVSPFGTEQSPEKAHQVPGAGTKAGHGFTSHLHTCPPIPLLQRLPLLCVRHSLQTSSPEGITPQRAAWLPQERWEPCQLMAWHSYRQREAWD